MSQRSSIKRKEWEAKIENWRQSSKSALAWCQENQINYTLFISWRKRLDLDSKNLKGKRAQSASQTSFIELKDKAKDSPGIILECAGVKIYLSKDFDAALLRKCLSVLQGASC